MRLSFECIPLKTHEEWGQFQTIELVGPMQTDDDVGVLRDHVANQLYHLLWRTKAANTAVPDLAVLSKFRTFVEQVSGPRGALLRRRKERIACRSTKDEDGDFRPRPGLVNAKPILEGKAKRRVVEDRVGGRR